MRNGNNSAGKIIEVRDYSSYPTYEEWKRAEHEFNDYNIYSSYPTYEEWKQIIGLSNRFYRGDRSYPTYEEWKHS